MSKQSTNSGGIGFFGLLAIVFITLKLTGHITWSWWLITAPLWAPISIMILFVSVVFIVGLMLDTK